MDPLTHTVIGLAVSKTAGNRIAVSDPATMCIVAGSIIPDIDILLQKWGDVTYLKNHRGATHSIPGMMISSALIAAAACLVYHRPDFFRMFLWALAGSLSHAFFDLFNTYGAKLLWPFTDKKYSLGMMLTFDPVFILLLGGYSFIGGSLGDILLAAFWMYFLSRILARILVMKELSRKFGDRYTRISLLPSMKGLFKWHFVLDNEECNIVGEKDIIHNRIRVIKRLYKNHDAEDDKIMDSSVGQFFTEFTPLYHVACEKNGEIKRYVFTDMRYYVKNKFLHHAVLEIDQNDSIVKQTFNPYSMKRNCIMG